MPHLTRTLAGRPVLNGVPQPLSPQSPITWWREEARKLGLSVSELRQQVRLADEIISELIEEERAESRKRRRPNRTREKNRPVSRNTRDVLGAPILGSPVLIPSWMTQLAERYRRRFVPEADAPPTLVLTPSPTPDRFCGRHFPRENVVAICLSGEQVVTRTVLVHELTHWARKYHGDPRGKHDAAFLREVRDAYQYFRVPRHLAVEIDHDLPR